MINGETESRVNAHYGHQDYAARILDVMRAAGKDLNSLTADDIAPSTHFTRGKAGLLDVLSLADLRPGMRVLDIGSGLGGPARTLATDFDCQVTGLELTEEFHRAAVLLTEMTGLNDRVTLVQGNALDLPFPDQSFDAVLTTQIAMHLEDKERLYGQIHRVLRPGGQYVFQDFMAGPEEPMLYPVPWAKDDSVNFIWQPNDIRELLLRLGFRERHWVDQTAGALSAGPMAPAAPGAIPTAPQLLQGDSLPLNGQMMMRNYEEGRLTIYRGVFVRA
ncbi:MAG: class I SAM-dependent methyltransferase [Chloroflexota bacterium]